MKKFLLALVFIGGVITLTHAQTAPSFTPAPGAQQGYVESNTVNVPDSVVRKFIYDFPNAAHSQWFPDGKKDIAAVFQESDDSVRAIYTISGTLVRTIRKLDTTVLPQGAKDYLAKKYPTQKPTGVWRITVQNTNTYEVKIGKSKLDFDVYGVLIPVEATTKKKTATAQ